MPDGLPAEIDLTRPSAARVYDYFLGGAHNFEIDRQLAEQIAGMTPNLAATMRAGREFLRRAVRVLLDAGIDQFLDIGSGIPTVGNVHEVAQAANPQGPGGLRRHRPGRGRAQPGAARRQRADRGHPRRPARAGADPRRGPTASG